MSESADNDFRAAAERITAPPPGWRIVHFSYRIGELLRTGVDPRLAWQGGDYSAAAEPDSTNADTTDQAIADHVAGLDWLIRDILDHDPDAVINLVGFSLGGIVALAWVAEQTCTPESPLHAIHRLVALNSPLGGITPLAALATLPGIRGILRRLGFDFGKGRALREMITTSPVMHGLRRASEKVDVASIENSRDYLINGHRIPGQILLSPRHHTIPLGRGAAATLAVPAGQRFQFDMGGWDRDIGGTHRLILDGESTGVDAARQCFIHLLTTDGVIWAGRHPAGD
jgi:hypothetical protein